MASRIWLKRENLAALIIVLALVLQVFFFVPMHVVMLNSGALEVPFIDLLAVHLALSLGLILGLYLVVRILDMPGILALLSFLGLGAFLEFSFFFASAEHGIPVSGPVDWQSLQWLSYLELGTLLVAGVLMIIYRRRTALFAGISLVILVFLAMGFVRDISGNFEHISKPREDHTARQEYLDQFFRLSDKRNIIHIVPDEAQGAMLHEILTTEYERYAQLFDGFTLYTQAMGRYAATYPNVIFSLSGESPQPAPDLVLNQPFTSSYVADVLRKRSILPALAQDSFQLFGFHADSPVLCQGPYTACAGSREDVFAGGDLNSPGRKLILAVLKTMDMALFQTTPIILRERVHDDGRWLVKKLAKGGFTHSGVLGRLVENLQVESNPGTYNYIHHGGAGAPLLFNRKCDYTGPRAVNAGNRRQQLTCMLEQLSRVILALKNAGIYDQTMIIVNAGHGSTSLPRSFTARSGYGVPPSLMGQASTLLLIKPPGARGELDFSDRQVTIGDIPATIMDVFGLAGSFPGNSLLEEESGTGRQRDFYLFDPPVKGGELNALLNLQRYRVHGSVFNARDWDLPQVAGAGTNLSQLRMNHADFDVYTEGFSDLEEQQVPVRWVDGRQARVFLAAPSTGPVLLDFESYVPPVIGGQSMVIKVNGTLVAKLDAQTLAVAEHTLPLPDGLPRGELLEIEFTMGKTVKLGDDLRNLSVLFMYVGLIPAY
ncbi:MAG: hypothetical protein HKO88_00190 [Xanthomonadales bacterium]|nr:hypothetical protein [Xanthomonadales bacterium]